MSGPSIAVERRDVAGAERDPHAGGPRVRRRPPPPLQPERIALLEARKDRQRELDAGVLPDFPVATADVRAAEWTVAPAPPTSTTGGSRSPGRPSRR